MWGSRDRHALRQNGCCYWGQAAHCPQLCTAGAASMQERCFLGVRTESPFADLNCLPVCRAFAAPATHCCAGGRGGGRQWRAPAALPVCQPTQLLPPLPAAPEQAHLKCLPSPSVFVFTAGVACLEVASSRLTKLLLLHLMLPCTTNPFLPHFLHAGTASCTCGASLAPRPYCRSPSPPSCSRARGGAKHIGRCAMPILRLWPRLATTCTPLLLPQQ